MGVDYINKKSLNFSESQHNIPTLYMHTFTIYVHVYSIHYNMTCTHTCTCVYCSQHCSVSELQRKTKYDITLDHKANVYQDNTPPALT